MDKSISFGYNAALAIRKEMFERLIESKNDIFFPPWLYNATPSQTRYHEVFYISFPINDEIPYKALHGLIENFTIKINTSRESNEIILNRASLILSPVQIVLQPVEYDQQGAYQSPKEFEIIIPCDLQYEYAKRRFKFNFEDISLKDIQINPSLDTVPYLENYFDEIIDEIIEKYSGKYVDVCIRIAETNIVRAAEDLAPYDPGCMYDFVWQEDATGSRQSANFGLHFLESPQSHLNIPFFLEEQSTFSFRMPGNQFRKWFHANLNSRFFHQAPGVRWIEKYDYTEDNIIVTISPPFGDTPTCHEGYLHFEGELHLKKFYYASTDEFIRYKVNIELDLDPATGRTIVNTKSIDYQFLSTLIDPALLLILTFKDFSQKIKDIIQTQLVQPLSGVSMDNCIFEVSERRPTEDPHGLVEIPGSGDLQPYPRFVFFPEKIKVQPNGVIITGSMDAGIIDNGAFTEYASVRFGAGRGPADSFPVIARAKHYSYVPKLEEALGPKEITNPRHEHEKIEYSRVRFDPVKRTISVDNGDIEDLGIVDFEALDVKALSDEGIRNYKDSLPPIPHDQSLIGRVFAVRTLGKSYGKIHTLGKSHGKIRIDQCLDGDYYLRWVIYQGPLSPSIEIYGAYEKYFVEPFHGVEWSGADRYFADTYLMCPFGPIRRSQIPFKVKWTYEGPEKFEEINDSDPPVFGGRLDIHTAEMDEDYFLATLHAQATDIFGRTAKTVRHFEGSKPSARPRHEHFTEFIWKTKIIPDICSFMVGRLKQMEQKAVEQGASPESLQELRIPLEGILKGFDDL